MSTTRNNLVINLCKFGSRTGCHRSLASSNSQKGVIKDNIYGGDRKDACVRATDLQVQNHLDRKCGECRLSKPDQRANDENRAIARQLLEPIVAKVNTRLDVSADPRPKFHPSNTKRKDENEVSRARQEEKERWSRHHAEREADRSVRMDDDNPKKPGKAPRQQRGRSR